MSRTPVPDQVMRLFTDARIPGDPLPVPSPADLSRFNEVTDPLLRIIDDGVTHALDAAGARAYFSEIRRTKPDLFYKYVALAIAAKARPSASPGKVLSVLSPLAQSPLDADPSAP